MEAAPGNKVAVREPAEPAGTQLITLDPKTYVTQVFAPFMDRLAAAKAEAAKIKVVDVSTKQGLALAVRHRATFRAIRIEAENARVFRKAPILAIGRLLDSRNNEIAAEVTKEEERFDNAIKAHERAEAAAKQAAILAEQERLAAIERQRKEAEDRQRAEEKAALERQRAELEAREAAARAAQEQAKLALEEAERQSRLRIEQQEREARAALEEEGRKARELQERNQAALSEIQGIQQQVIIAQAGRLGVRAGGTIKCIRETLAETEAWNVDPVRFGTFAQAAAKAKEKAIGDIQVLLQVAIAREAEDARRRAEHEKLEAERLAAEEAQRKLRLAEELLAAAARREQEERERKEREAAEALAKAERDRLEAEQRARAAEEQRKQDEEAARRREIKRKETEQLEGRAVLHSFVERYGAVEEFAEVAADINRFLASAPAEVPALESLG